MWQKKHEELVSFGPEVVWRIHDLHLCPLFGANKMIVKEKINPNENAEAKSRHVKQVLIRYEAVSSQIM